MASLLEYDIRPEDTVFFLHIPKTAGTTLRKHLNLHFGDAHTCVANQPYDLQKQIAQSTRALPACRYYCGHLMYDMVHTLFEREPICLTVLRDPIQRLISAWAHFRRHPGLADEPRERRELHQKIAAMSLDTFLMEANADWHWRLQDTQTALIGAQSRLWPANQLYETARNVQQQLTAPDLARALDRLGRFAWFGLTERFQESLMLLAYTFGWHPLRDILRLNVAPQRPYLEQIAPATLSRILALNKYDLQLYEAATLLFEQRYAAMSSDLVARYGDQAHARQPSPLPTDTLLELLERHYRARYARQYAPVSQVRLHFDQPIDGEGWDMSERTPLGEPYRWIGPRPAAFVDLPLAAGQHYHICIRVIHALSLDTLHSLRLTVNSIPVPLTVTTAPDQATCFDGIIPASALPDGLAFARLQFQVDQTLRPADLADDRLLGVAISQIHITPTTDLSR